MHPQTSLLKRFPHDDFPHDDFPSTPAVVCTAFTFLTTVILEITLHVLLSQYVAGPPTKTPNGLASLALRAKRLAVACAIYPVILTLFTIRLVDGTGPWGLYLVSVVPFVCATFAVLRTVVDCVLVRFRTGLTLRFGGEGVLWLPLMPFSLVVVGLYGFGKKGAGWIMGTREQEVEEVAVEGDEMDGLVGDAEGTEDGEGEGLPGYDEVVGAGGKTVDRRAEGNLV